MWTIIFQRFAFFPTLFFSFPLRAIIGLWMQKLIATKLTCRGEFTKALILTFSVDDPYTRCAMEINSVHCFHLSVQLITLSAIGIRHQT